MSSRSKAIAIKRINKDIKEIMKSPIEGIGIASLDNDLMKYVINIRLMSGIYEGYCVQLLLTFSDNYPTKPPKILIYPDQAIDGQYHHHIFPDSLTDENGHHFKKFCFDLLDNDFMNISEEHTGWNPSYSISSLLLQVQNFIADPDMHHLPSKQQISQLMSSMKNYQRTFIVYEDDKKITKIHTWSNPYPEMYSKKNNKKINEDEEKVKNAQENEKRMRLIKENLTCFMLKLNYIDDPEVLLGYPIVKSKGLGRDKIELYPIPELISYDGYITQIGKQDNKLDYYFETNFKSANNEFYNCWVPIYIDKNHYEKNKTAILNSFSIIKFGAKGIKEYDFKPNHIFEILPIILNKMIIGMFSGKSAISSAFIISYFHYVLLFKKLCMEYEEEYTKYLDEKINSIEKNDYIPNKSIIPDIGNFFMLLFFSNKDMHSKKMEKIWYCLFEEFLVRQMYWLFHNGGEIVMLLEEISIPQTNQEINEFKKEIFDLKFKGDYAPKNECNLLINCLKESSIFLDVIDIISKDEKVLKQDNLDINSIKMIIVNKIMDNYKGLFNECSDETKEKLYKLLMFNETFYKNFILNGTSESEYFKKKEEIIKVKYFLKTKEAEKFIKESYESYRGNKLLLITFFAQKKMEEKGFMEELEKNYGIYFDVDNFIKGMKEKLKEIQSYQQFFKYIGSEYGIDKDDVEIFKDAYEKAEKRGYFKNLIFQNKFLSSSYNNISYGGRGGFRGRGRGRGRRGMARGGRGGW